MKALIISHLFPHAQDPYRGIFVVKQLQEMKQLCDVEIIAPVPWFPPIKISKKWFGYSQVPKRENNFGISVWRPRWVTFPRGYLLPLTAMNYYMAIERHLLMHEIHFDIIHAHGLFPDGFVAARLGSKWKRPVIITSHGADTFTSLKRLSTRTMAKYAIHHAQKIIAVSESDRLELLRHNMSEKNVIFVSNGVDTDKFFPMDQLKVRQLLRLPLDKKIVLFVGYLFPVKGIEYLIKAMVQIQSQRNDVHLVIVGDGYLKKRLFDLSHMLDLDGLITFAGVQSHDTIPLWMNACDLFCLPSLMEGWPTVLFEAMACGKPIVASRVGGIPEVLKDSDFGILVEPRNPDSLASGVLSGLNRVWNPQRFIQRAQANTWREKTRQIFEEVYLAVEHKRIL